VRSERRGLSVGALIAALLLCSGFAAFSARSETAGGRTVVWIRGDSFVVNGAEVYARRPIHGLLMNSRMVQAVWDDRNPATAPNFAYPDTRRWSAQRNTNEFVRALPVYAAWGLRCVTVGFQGGNPWPTGNPRGYGGNDQPNISSGFEADGSLNAQWLGRLERVLTVASRVGIVVIVQYFYWGQDQRLANDDAVIRATDGLTDWLMGVHNAYRKKPYTNVLVEVANEANDRNYDRTIIRDHVTTLMDRVRSRSHNYLKVGTSLDVGTTNAIVAASDYVNLHGAGGQPAQITSMVQAVRAMPAYRTRPKPIVITEDAQWAGPANLDAAVAAGAGYGFFDKGSTDYRNGYQSPPVDWSVGTAAKRAFFERVAAFAGVKRHP
jgi:hypothetical protein